MNEIFMVTFKNLILVFPIIQLNEAKLNEINTLRPPGLELMELQI